MQQLEGSVVYSDFEPSRSHSKPGYLQQVQEQVEADIQAVRTAREGLQREINRQEKTSIWAVIEMQHRFLRRAWQLRIEFTTTELPDVPAETVLQMFVRAEQLMTELEAVKSRPATEQELQKFRAQLDAQLWWLAHELFIQEVRRNRPVPDTTHDQTLESQLRHWVAGHQVWRLFQERRLVLSPQVMDTGLGGGILSQKGKEYLHEFSTVFRVMEANRTVRPVACYYSFSEKADAFLRGQTLQNQELLLHIAKDVMACSGGGLRCAAEVEAFQAGIALNKLQLLLAEVTRQTRYRQAGVFAKAASRLQSLQGDIPSGLGTGLRESFVVLSLHRVRQELLSFVEALAAWHGSRSEVLRGFRSEFFQVLVLLTTILDPYFLAFPANSEIQEFRTMLRNVLALEIQRLPVVSTAAGRPKPVDDVEPSLLQPE